MLVIYFTGMLCHHWTLSAFFFSLKRTVKEAGLGDCIMSIDLSESSREAYELFVYHGQAPLNPDGASQAYGLDVPES